jgi:hypothetical protein
VIESAFQTWAVAELDLSQRERRLERRANANAGAGELVANGLAGTFRVAFLKELGDIAEKSHDGNYHGAREPDKKYDLKKKNE